MNKGFVELICQQCKKTMFRWIGTKRCSECKAPSKPKKDKDNVKKKDLWYVIGIKRNMGVNIDSNHIMLKAEQREKLLELRIKESRERNIKNMIEYHERYYKLNKQ